MHFGSSDRSQPITKMLAPAGRQSGDVGRGPVPEERTSSVPFVAAGPLTAPEGSPDPNPGAPDLAIRLERWGRQVFSRQLL